MKKRTYRKIYKIIMLDSAKYDRRLKRAIISEFNNFSREYQYIDDSAYYEYRTVDDIQRRRG